MNRLANFDRYCVDMVPILEAISHNGLGINAEYQREFLGRIQHDRVDSVPRMPGRLVRKDDLGLRETAG